MISILGENSKYGVFWSKLSHKRRKAQNGLFTKKIPKNRSNNQNYGVDIPKFQFLVKNWKCAVALYMSKISFKVFFIFSRILLSDSF